MDPPQWNFFQPPVSEPSVMDYNRSSYNNSLSQPRSTNSFSSQNSGSGTSQYNGFYDQQQQSSSSSNSFLRSSNSKSTSSMNNLFPSSSYSSGSYPHMNSNTGSGPASQQTYGVNRSADNHHSSNNYYSSDNSSSSHYGSSSNAPPISDFKIGTFTLNANGYPSESGSQDSSASNFSSQRSTSNSFQSSNGTLTDNQSVRETGIIEKLLQTYGFIQCCERQARLFFHFSQFDGNTEHLRIGDPVEFEVTFDRRTGKPIASSVTKISPEVVLSEERVIGIVTTEIKSESGGEKQGRITYENRGECFFLPYSKEDVEGYVTLKPLDRVSFQIATNQRSGNLAAQHARLENPTEPVKYKGVVSAIKDSYGFIERGDVVDEIFFHFSEAKTIPEGLKLGDDVEFLIQSRNGKEVATNMVRLPPGTVVFEDINQEEIRGQVLKPVEKALKQNQKDPLTGRIRYRGKDRSEVEVKFGERDQRADFTLRHGDWVKFNIATDRRDNLQKATNISLLGESFQVSGEKREEGIIHSLKDGFGYIKCADRDARMYFSFNEILDPQWKITVNEEVEFTVISDTSSVAVSSAPSSSTGNNVAAPPRQCATRIRKLTPGTVKFEILIQESLEGEVTLEPNYISSSPSVDNNSGQMMSVVTQPGIISFYIEGVKQTLNFYPNDQSSITASPSTISSTNPRLGDRVQFSMFLVKRTKERVAMNIKILAPIMTSVTPGRQSMVGSGRTFDRGSTGMSTLEPFKLMSLAVSADVSASSSNFVSAASPTNVSVSSPNFVSAAPSTYVSASSPTYVSGLSPSAASPYNRENPSSTTCSNDSISCNALTTTDMSVIVDDLIDLSDSHSPPKKIAQKEVGGSPTSSSVLLTSGIETKPLVPEFVNTRKPESTGVKLSASESTSARVSKSTTPKLSATESTTTRLTSPTITKATHSKSGGNSYSRPIPVHQGFIATLKETFGFIETINHDKEIFFHFSNSEMNINDLDLGHEVEYSISSRTGPGGKLSAENVKLLPVGSIATPKILGEVFEGTVLRSMRSVNPDQQEYCGQVCVGKEDEKLGRHQFGITGLVNKKELLQPGDSVNFQLDEDGWAVNVRAVRKKLLATVEAVKGQYGFLNYENDEGKKLFFHQSEVKDSITLSPGDEVQFVIITNLKTGKSSACNISRLLSSSGPSQRPDRLVSRLKGLSKDTTKRRIEVIRQPKGPDSSKGFNLQRTIT